MPSPRRDFHLGSSLTTHLVSGCWLSFSLLVFAAYTGLSCGASPVYFASVAAASLHLMRTIASVDLSDPASCKSGFDASAKGTGAMLGTGVATDVLLKAGYIL